MFRTVLALAFGAALSLGGAPVASAAPITQAAPAADARVILAGGQRHHRGHVSRGYGNVHHGYDYARPRYLGHSNYRPSRGHRGYGTKYIYLPGPRHAPRHRSYGYHYGR